VFNTTRNTSIAEKAVVADTFLSRMVGLLKHASLPNDEALIITRCNSIHMFFMRFAIDVLFVDKQDCIVGIVKNIKPFQLSPIFFKARYAIELAAGAIDQSQTVLGDKIQIYGCHS